MNNIQRVLSEGRLIRGRWSGISGGRQLLCLYTAWIGYPDARPYDCPAEAAPLWFAELMPWIDDAGSEEKWLEVVTRVAALEPKFSKFGRRELIGCLIVILTEKQRHADLPACRSVVALCERELLGDGVTEEEWTAAGHAAEEERTWTGAAVAAWVAAKDTTAASATGAVAVARMTRTTAAGEIAADRIIDGILTVLEAT